MRRAVSAATPAPSATDDASCGQLDRDTFISRMEAAASADSCEGPSIFTTSATRSAGSSFSSDSAVTPSRMPWSSGRPSSRSKRSMSSSPRSLVSITTGMLSARARCLT